MPFGIWPDLHIESMRECLLAGLSFAKCAVVLNNKFNTSYTRSAIIGKARRENIPCTKVTMKKEAAQRKPAVIRIRVRPDPIKVEPVVAVCAADVEPLHLSLLDLGANQCRWPFGEDAPFTFCGHFALDGDSYCLSHKRLAWLPPQQRRAA